jgi:CRP-like cAMP-binding protein
MMMDPNDRYQSVQEMSNDIDSLVNGHTALVKKVFKKDTTIIKEGDTDSEAYVILKGRVEVFKIINGNNVSIGYLSEGESIGEIALISSLPRSASVIAVENTEVAVIEKSMMTRGLENLPPWITQIIKTLVERLRSATEKPDIPAKSDNTYRILFLLRVLYPFISRKKFDSTSTAITIAADYPSVIEEISACLKINTDVTIRFFTRLFETGLIRSHNANQFLIPNYNLFCMFVDYVADINEVWSSVNKNEAYYFFAGDKQMIISLVDNMDAYSPSETIEVVQEDPEKVLGCQSWDQIPEKFKELYSSLRP